MRFNFAKCKVKHMGERVRNHKRTQVTLLQKVYYGLAGTNISLVFTRDQKVGLSTDKSQTAQKTLFVII